MNCVLGVDGGGTKTVAAVADADGRILGWAKAGCGCFEDVGDASAQNETRKAVTAAMEQAGVGPDNLVSACYGMAGADRKKDYARIGAFLHPINPARSMSVRNDVDLILKAGIPDGIGIAVGCGTGTNCIGCNRTGHRVQIGGIGYELGDRAGGTFLGLSALHHAMRGHDGRGRSTMLYDALCRTLGVEHLADVLDRLYVGARRRLDFSTLPPVVFECAAAGDEVATHLIEGMIEEIAIMVKAASSRLFGSDEAVSVVLGGGLISTGMLDFARRVEEALAGDGGARHFSVRRLDMEPVAGAVFYALDESGLQITEDVIRTASISLGQAR